MSPQDFFKDARRVETSSGRIGCGERGSWSVALFVHGVVLNGYFWRHQLESLREDYWRSRPSRTAATRSAVRTPSFTPFTSSG